MRLNSLLTDLNADTVSMLITHALDWCSDALGPVKDKWGAKRRPSVHMLTDEPDDTVDVWIELNTDLVADQCYGFWDADTHIIYINPNATRTVKRLLQIILHEYTHALQPNLHTRYAYANKQFGYERNPYEVHARAMEQYYKDIWQSFRVKK